MRSEYRLSSLLLSLLNPQVSNLLDKGTPPFLPVSSFDPRGGGFPRRGVVDLCRVETCRDLSLSLVCELRP